MRVAFHGVSGAGLTTTVLPVASAWPSFCRVTSNGKFHGTMAPTTPAGSLTTLRQLRVAEGLAVGQVALPRELVDRGRRPQQAVLERRVELGPVGDQDRAADLGHQLGPEQLLLADDGLLQLLEAALAELPVGRPVVSSNARRAAPMARSMSSAPASAT